MDYQNGKIYKVINTVNEDIYIGSTTQNLIIRLTSHFSASNVGTSRRNSLLNNCIKDIGKDNFSIELIEKVECNTKEELLIREQYYIDLLKPKLNQFNAIKQSEDFYKNNKKKVYQENKDFFLEKSKKYYAENKEHVAIIVKEYREQNKEKISEQRKLYREQNKEKIKEKKSQKYICECGVESTISHKSRHIKSKFHLEFLTK